MKFMKNFVKNLFAWILTNHMHAFATIHSIILYTHIKNIPFQSFMIWAFGDNWQSLQLTDLHEVWNAKHGDLVKINAIKDMSAIIFKMVDWYISINKPV